MRASLLLRGLLSAMLLTPSWHQSSHSAWTLAAAEAATASTKVTAPQLLLQMRRSIVFIANEAKKLAPQDRAHMVPFFKALTKTADGFKTLDAAHKAHATKDYAKAILATAESFGRLDATYRLANSKDKPIGAAMHLLGDDWRVFLRHYGGGRGGNADTAKKNSRRIAALRKHLLHLAKKRDAHAKEKKHIAEMIAKLDKAALLNRSKGDQWLTLALMSDVTGWYGGYYDYYLVYDPNIASYYKHGYHYFQEIFVKYEVEFESYYSEYSWDAYEAAAEETTIHSPSTDAALLAEEEAVTTAEESIDETAVENVDAELIQDAADLPAAAEELKSIDEAEAAADEAPAANFEDPADVANEEADTEAATEISDEAADADFTEAEEADTSDMADEDSTEEADDSSPEPAEDAGDD